MARFGLPMCMLNTFASCPFASSPRIVAEPNAQCAQHAQRSTPGNHFSHLCLRLAVLSNTIGVCCGQHVQSAELLELEQPELGVQVEHLQYWANDGEFTQVGRVAGARR